jgi:hypothetical protein
MTEGENIIIAIGDRLDRTRFVPFYNDEEVVKG